MLPPGGRRWLQRERSLISFVRLLSFSRKRNYNLLLFRDCRWSSGEKPVFTKRDGDWQTMGTCKQQGPASASRLFRMAKREGLTLRSRDSIVFYICCHFFSGICTDCICCCPYTSLAPDVDGNTAFSLCSWKFCHLHSGHLKPVRLSILYETQNNIFWRMMATKHLLLLFFEITDYHTKTFLKIYKFHRRKNKALQHSHTYFC